MAMGLRCHGFLNRAGSDEHTVKDIVLSYKSSLTEDLEFIEKLLEALTEEEEMKDFKELGL